MVSEEGSDAVANNAMSIISQHRDHRPRAICQYLNLTKDILETCLYAWLRLTLLIYIYSFIYSFTTPIHVKKWLCVVILGKV